MTSDLVLPAFEFDCRDWLVISPADAGFPDELGEAPLIAVLSSAVITADELRPVSVVLTLGLLDAGSPVAPGSGVAELLESEDGVTRYLLPTPDRRLALVAECARPVRPDAEGERRVRALMASFRWAV